ncbi:hypothetical protein QLQ09_24400 [Brucella sp. NM4]|nr:hypothetical protein [Brucella sp. NM4]WHS33950.1 hypothetical protein QLQ09_24400 [Brucella sp. NM4]
MRKNVAANTISIWATLLFAFATLTLALVPKCMDRWRCYVPCLPCMDRNADFA